MTRALDGTHRPLFERWHPALANHNAAGNAQAERHDRPTHQGSHAQPAVYVALTVAAAQIAGTKSDHLRARAFRPTCPRPGQMATIASIASDRVDCLQQRPIPCIVRPKVERTRVFARAIWQPRAPAVGDIGAWCINGLRVGLTALEEVDCDSPEVQSEKLRNSFQWLTLLEELPASDRYKKTRSPCGYHRIGRLL